MNGSKASQVGFIDVFSILLKAMAFTCWSPPWPCSCFVESKGRNIERLVCLQRPTSSLDLPLRMQPLGNILLSHPIFLHAYSHLHISGVLKGSELKRHSGCRRRYRHPLRVFSSVLEAHQRGSSDGTRWGQKLASHPQKALLDTSLAPRNLYVCSLFST